MQTTFPRLLLKHANERPEAPAMREKEYGIWQTTTCDSMRLRSLGESNASQGICANSASVGRRRR